MAEGRREGGRNQCKGEMPVMQEEAQGIDKKAKMKNETAVCEVGILMKKCL